MRYVRIMGATRVFYGEVDNMSLYEPDEWPKKCPKCSNIASMILQSYELRRKNARRRQRECTNCGEKYNTLTRRDMRFI